MSTTGYSVSPFLFKPVTFFVVSVGVIGTFHLFDQSYIFSGGTGGPNNVTLTVVLLIYQAAFRNLQMGYADAIAFLLAVVIIATTGKFFSKNRYFGAGCSTVWRSPSASPFC
jgi:multiple sugar transport system permease protein